MTQGSLRYRQRRARQKTSFDFGEEELTYMFDSGGARTGGTVAYHKIPGRTGFRAIRMWWLKYVFAFYVIFSIILSSHYWSVNDFELFMGGLWITTLAFLVMCLFAFSRRQAGVTLFPLNPVLAVLHDGKQEVILAEIMKRRRDMMRAKLAQVDSARPYYEEASKFSWLREENIVSETEYRQAREKIAAMREQVLKAGQGK